jgi:hypothetical protein
MGNPTETVPKPAKKQVMVVQVVITGTIRVREVIKEIEMSETIAAIILVLNDQIAVLPIEIDNVLKAQRKDTNTYFPVVHEVLGLKSKVVLLQKR